MHAYTYIYYASTGIYTNKQLTAFFFIMASNCQCKRSIWPWLILRRNIQGKRFLGKRGQLLQFDTVWKHHRRNIQAMYKVQKNIIYCWESIIHWLLLGVAEYCGFTGRRLNVSAWLITKLKPNGRVREFPLTHLMEFSSQLARGQCK